MAAVCVRRRIMEREDDANLDAQGRTKSKQLTFAVAGSSFVLS